MFKINKVSRSNRGEADIFNQNWQTLFFFNISVFGYMDDTHYGLSKGKDFFCCIKLEVNFGKMGRDHRNKLKLDRYVSCRQ